MPLPPQSEIIFDLPPEDQNAISVKILKEAGKELREFIRDLIRNPRSPAVKLGPTAKHEWFMDHVADAYYLGPRMTPEDRGRWADFQQWPQFYDAQAILMQMIWLEQDDYVDQIRAGTAPPPLSKPFVNYVGGGWLALEEWLAYFRELHKRYMPEGETQQSARETEAVY